MNTQYVQPRRSGSPDPRKIQPALANLICDPYLNQCNSNPTAYVDVFVDEFLGLVQEGAHRRHYVWSTLFRVLDKVFQPQDANNSSNQNKVLSLKNIDTEECIWSTFHVLLRWVADTVKTKLSLPSHWEKRFRYILSAILCT